MVASSKSQRGVSLSGLLMAAVIFGTLAVFAMKLAPDVIDYFKTMAAIKALSADGNLKAASPAEIRKAFERRAQIDQISAVTPQDIEVRKDGGDLVLSFAYTKRIPLFKRVSLVIDFEGSTAK